MEGVHPINDLKQERTSREQVRFYPKRSTNELPSTGESKVGRTGGQTEGKTLTRFLGRNIQGGKKLRKPREEDLGLTPEPATAAKDRKMKVYNPTFKDPTKKKLRGVNRVDE